MNKKILLSLIIPAYNEEKIIKDTLSKVIKFLAKKNYSWEVLVVDDGSTDNTAKIAKGFSKKKVRVLSFVKNKGKGAAIREGVLVSKGEFIIFMDADLSVPLTNIDKFLDEFKKEEIVIASRRAEGAKIVVHQPWLRENLGRIHTFLSRVVTGVNISDFTCGFKGFTRNAALKIFTKAIIDRWAYDDEIMFLAKKFGFRIKEVPVEWENRKDTRVKFKDVVFGTPKDLLMIKLNDLLGIYANN